MSKEGKTNVVALPAEPVAAPKKPARKRKREREGGAPSAVSAAESAARRIDALLASIRERSTELVDAQRSSPGRWQHFAQLAAIEDRLRSALAPEA
jgi:hypothetical protein